MFVPKWLLAVLFFIAISSTVGMLYLLATRALPTTPKPTASARVVVQESVIPSPTQSSTTPASPSALLASAEWKKYTSTNLSLKLEYPADWTLNATTSAGINIVSNKDKSNQAAVKIDIARVKKSPVSQKMSVFLDQKAKERETVFSDEKNVTINDYDAVSRVYKSDKVNLKEIVFATKNYFYIVTIEPSSSPLDAVIEEIIKTIEIV